jgi:hypothetical protein
VFEIGSSLREARLRQGVDFVEAEAATKIRSKYLHALEDEQFEVLPAQTYVKGFLRAYADYLGLDGQLYVDEYNSRYVGAEEEPVLRPRRGSSTSRTHRRIESSVVALALVGIATAAALVIVAWKWGGDTPNTLPGLDDRAAPTTANGRPSPPRSQRAFSVELLATRGPTWVEVRRGAAIGPVLFEGTIDRGKSQPFTQKRVWVNVAVPENLAVKIQGHAARVPRARVLIVTPKGIRAVPQA